MDISIIAVGKVKEKYILDGINEFLKRLNTLANVQVREVADEKAPSGMSARAAEQVKQKEAARIMRLLRDGQVVVALAVEGRQLSSEQLAGKLAQWALSGRSDIVFIIGGSLGLHPSILARADLQLSFGRLTFPHQLMRLLLLEQIYRACKINRGEPYHK